MSARDYIIEDFNFSSIQIKSDYIHAYDFEVFDAPKLHNFVVTSRPLMFTILAVYLLGAHFGQKWMSDRPAYKLNSALFFWNAALALFSIVATIRMYPEALYFVSKPNGMYLAVCSGEETNYATVFWASLFLFSKIVELGDTAFIVLRKQKLIVLHWLHHVMTLMMCWIGFEYAPAISRFIFVNTFVHSFMYSYYALKALKIRIPRNVSMALTAIQITQLAFGAYLLTVVIHAIKTGLPCRISMDLVRIIALTVIPVLILFIHFFLRAYLQKNKSKAQ